MSLTALYYVHSVKTRYNVYRFKHNETIRNGEKEETLKHTKKYIRQRNGGKYKGK
jgi:hypothetical protein